MDVKDQAFEDWKNGMKYKEIADKYEVSLSAVKSWATRYWKHKKVATITEKVATQIEKVATKEPKKLQPEKGKSQKSQPSKKKKGAPKGNKNAKGNQGGAPEGNKNSYKHGIYEKMFFEFLTPEEQEFALDTEIDQIEECKRMIRFCDLQILKFVRLTKEVQERPGGLVVSGASKKKGSVKGWQRGEQSDYEESQTVTNIVAAHELILRYNTEIEKIKKQKIKCLELLFKLAPTEQQEYEDDGFIQAMTNEIDPVWDDDEDGEGDETN